MIIALFLFIVFCICSIIMLGLILGYIFTDKLNQYRKEIIDMTIPTLICLFVAVCSAQYVWG